MLGRLGAYSVGWFATHFQDEAYGTFGFDGPLDRKTVRWFVLQINRLVLSDWTIDIKVS